MKKYSPQVKAQIDRAGSYDNYRAVMKERRAGKATVDKEQIIALSARLTQEQIAEKLGCTQSWVSQVLKRSRHAPDN